MMHKRVCRLFRTSQRLYLVLMLLILLLKMILLLPLLLLLRPKTGLRCPSIMVLFVHKVNVEIITDLEDIVKELLRAFEKESNRRPQQLIFYRYGVCESLFKQVLEKEIPEIEKAWKALYGNEKPQITFIVVQKRHSIRLFPNANKHKCHVAKKDNVKPGIVIDSGICHPAEFDFFLCSNPDIRGARHPVQYLVLRDDNNFTADELQVLTNNLCYTYTSCTQSMPIAPPAHYAHKLAQRAHLYLAQDPNHVASAGSNGGANAPAGGPKQLPDIKDELKRSMFYC